MMLKKNLAVLLLAVATTTTWAGPPGEKTNGSTTETLSTSFLGDDSCIVQDIATNFAFDTEVSDATDAFAWAAAVAQASAALEIVWSGDVTLNLTRHGNNGAVFQVDMVGAIGSGQLFALTSYSGSFAGSEVSAEEAAEVEVFAQAVAELFPSFHAGLDIVVASVSLDGFAGGAGYADVAAEAEAFASTESSTLATSSSRSSVTGGGSAASGSNVYVQGANIEEFQAGLNLTAANVMQVDTRVLASNVANAYATSVVYAAAEARAEALLAAGLEFCYEVAGSGDCVTLLDFEDSVVRVANSVASKSEEIWAFANAYATAYANAMTGSGVASSVVVTYENLPGTEDLLELVSNGSGTLVCGANVGAIASANAQIVD